jgi:hypothetical protein
MVGGEQQLADSGEIDGTRVVRRGGGDDAGG